MQVGQLMSVVQQVEDTITKLSTFFTEFKLMYAFEWVLFFLVIYFVWLARWLSTMFFSSS